MELNDAHIVRSTAKGHENADIVVNHTPMNGTPEYPIWIASRRNASIEFMNGDLKFEGALFSLDQAEEIALAILIKVRELRDAAGT